MPGISVLRMLGIRKGLAVVLAGRTCQEGERKISSATCVPETNIQMACCWAAQGGITEEKGSNYLIVADME